MLMLFYKGLKVFLYGATLWAKETTLISIVSTLRSFIFLPYVKTVAAAAAAAATIRE